MRKLMRFALPFAVGAVLCQYCLLGAGRLWAGAAVLGAALTTACVVKQHRRTAMLMLCGLAAGILWFSAYDAVFLAPNEDLAGGEDTFTMTILDYPETASYGARAIVRAEGRRGRAVFYGDERLLALEPGNRVTARVKCYSAAKMGGSPSTYYTSQGVFLRLYAQGDQLAVEPGEAGSLRFLPQRLGRRLQDAVRFLYDRPAGGLIAAMLTGERSDLDEQSLSDLEEAGLFHITAVSGLHCGFLIGLLGLLLLRRRRLTALVGYPVLALYAVMVGGKPSVVRACVMVGFLLLADLVDREADAITSLSAALLMILLVNPFAIASLSLQLSFTSMAGLLVASPRIYRALGGGRLGKSRLGRRLWSFLMASLSAGLGTMLLTAPLSALCFRYLSLVSPLSNLLVLWIAPLLFGSALVLTILIPLVPALAPLAAVPELLAEYVLQVAGWTAKLPGHAAYFTSLLLALWLVYFYGMLALCALSGPGRRKYVLALGLGIISLAAVRAIPRAAVRDGELTVVAVDVGQGAATILASDGAAALVDCGSLYTPRGPGATVADTLHTYGWERLDYVALTHYHEDHAGGLPELLARVEVGRLLLPQMDANESQSDLQAEALALAERYGVPVTFIREPVAVELGRARLTAYPPLTEGDANEEGLTVLATAGDFDILITGDMGSSTERQLLETYQLPDIEVLAVGHHGSRYSTSEELLKAVTPEVGIISVGENSYGHPSDEAMERMAFAGMTLYRTDLQGNILIRVHGQNR